jgi:hypothetical protein
MELGCSVPSIHGLFLCLQRNESQKLRPNPNRSHGFYFSMRSLLLVLQFRRFCWPPSCYGSRLGDCQQSAGMLSGPIMTSTPKTDRTILYVVVLFTIACVAMVVILRPDLVDYVLQRKSPEERARERLWHEVADVADAIGDMSSISSEPPRSIEDEAKHRMAEHVARIDAANFENKVEKRMQMDFEYQSQLHPPETAIDDLDACVVELFKFNRKALPERRRMMGKFISLHKDTYEFKELAIRLGHGDLQEKDLNWKIAVIKKSFGNNQDFLNVINVE